MVFVFGATLEELLNLPFFLQVFRCLWIQFLHLCDFFVRDLRKMPNESYKLPTVFLIFIAGPAKSRHTRESNAVFNDVEDFTVGELLCFGLAQIRWFRIQTFAEQGIAASVVCMATGAMIGEVRHSFLQNFWTG